MTTQCLTVTGGGSIGKCGSLSQPSSLLVSTIMYVSTSLYSLTKANRYTYLPLSEHGLCGLFYRYLKFLMLSGTFIQDVPFLVVRLWTVAVISDSHSAGPGFSLLYALLLKSCCTVTCAAVALLVSPSSTSGDGDLDPDQRVHYRGLVARRSASLTGDGLIQQIPPNNDAEDADDEHFV